MDIELGQVQQRVLETARGQFLFRVTSAARDFLLQEGTDQRYGARHLKRAIERHIVYPLANLLATEQVHLGDLIRIDWDGEHKMLTFVRESEGALVENPLLPSASSAAAYRSAGRAIHGRSHRSRCRRTQDASRSACGRARPGTKQPKEAGAVDRNCSKI